MVRFVGDINRRHGDRRHLSVWSWRAPFNLTEVCRDGRGPDFGKAVAVHCVTEGRAPLAPGTPPELAQYLPLREIGSVDRDSYPRRAWLEIPLGIPDSVLFAVRCAWNGRATCAADAGSVSATRNWAGHVMLMAVALLAVWASAPGRVANRKTGWNPIAFVLVFLGGLAVTSVLAFAGLLALKALMWLSSGVLRLSSAVASMAAFRPVLWMASAVKDIATDRAATAISVLPKPRA